MTHALDKLVARGVHPEILEFRRWRMGVALTCVEASAHLGWSVSQLSRVESGERTASAELLQALRYMRERWDESRRPPCASALAWSQALEEAAGI